MTIHQKDEGKSKKNKKSKKESLLQPSLEHSKDLREDNGSPSLPSRGNEVLASEVPSMSINSEGNRTITSLNGSYVCQCGYSSTTKSGASRHKCRNEEDQELLQCSFCPKQCKTSGSMKLHVRARHKEKTCSQLENVVEEHEEQQPSVSDRAVECSIPANDENHGGPLLRRSSRRKSIANHKNKASATKK